MRKWMFTIIFSIVFLFSVMSVHAQDATGGKDWSFDLAPLYLWGVSISGDMGDMSMDDTDSTQADG